MKLSHTIIANFLIHTFEYIIGYFFSPIYVNKIIINCLHWKEVVKFHCISIILYLSGRLSFPIIHYIALPILNTL